MNFIQYYSLVLTIAVKHLFEATHMIILAIVFMLGVWSRLDPNRVFMGIKVRPHRMHSRKAVFIVFGSYLFVRLALAPYWIFQEQHDQPSHSWNEMAGPRSGPLGPIAAVELVREFKTISPCLVLITFPAESQLGRTIWLILEYGSNYEPVCRILRSPNIIDNDIQPNLKRTQSGGIVVHWDSERQGGARIAEFFESMALNVRRSRQLPAASDPDLIWIDIGPGSPWIDP